MWPCPGIWGHRDHDVAFDPWERGQRGQDEAVSPGKGDTRAVPQPCPRGKGDTVLQDVALTPGKGDTSVGMWQCLMDIETMTWPCPRGLGTPGSGCGPMVWEKGHQPQDVALSWDMGTPGVG